MAHEALTLREISCLGRDVAAGKCVVVSLPRVIGSNHAETWTRHIASTLPWVYGSMKSY